MKKHIITKLDQFINENKVLDNILDKMSQYGKEALTKKELEFLGKYSTESDFTDAEKEIVNRANRIKGSLAYDPREDTEFFKELSDESGIDFNFSKFNDEEMEDGHYDILWNDFEEDDIYHFAEYFKITDEELKKKLDNELVIKPWHELSPETKSKFKNYVNNII